MKTFAAHIRPLLVASTAALALLVPAAAQAGTVDVWNAGSGSNAGDDTRSGSKAKPPTNSRATVCDSVNAHPADAGRRQTVRATLCLLNRERARRNLRRLSLSPRLSRAAEAHSRAMVTKDFFSHDSLGGLSFLDRIRNAGYLRDTGSWSVGENIAWGSGNRATPSQIVRSWMQSPGHRANILAGRYREVGIGVAAGAPVQTGLPAATYTTDFGARG